MATYRNGPLGGFSGKLGPVVGTTWRDKAVLRSMPKKITQPPSEAQRLQRLKMSMVMDFLTPIRPLLKTTFTNGQKSQSGFDVAKSYHLKETMERMGDGWEIIFQKALISSGELRGLNGVTLTVDGPNTLRLNWSDDSNQAMATTTDTLLFVMYLPQLRQFEVFEAVATRQDTTALITYPAYCYHLEAQCWATLGTINGSKYAISTYLGKVLL